MLWWHSFLLWCLDLTTIVFWSYAYMVAFMLQLFVVHVAIVVNMLHPCSWHFAFVFLTSCICNAIARTSDDIFPTSRLQSLRVKKSSAILSPCLLASLRATRCAIVVASSLPRAQPSPPSMAHPPPPVAGDIGHRTPSCALLPDPADPPHRRPPLPSSSLSSLSR
jgi:hypothetical protein